MCSIYYALTSVPYLQSEVAKKKKTRPAQMLSLNRGYPSLSRGTEDQKVPYCLIDALIVSELRAEVGLQSMG